MNLAARPHDPTRRRALRAVAALAMVASIAVLRAAEPEITSFDLVSNEEGLLLSYSINMELSRSVDEALSKAVPLFFVAEADVFRSRFYWRDQRISQAVRRWRIVFQPLTGTYRVTFDGGLSQNYATRSDAFAAISRSARWKVAEPGQLEDGNRYYVEFNYRLDTTQLPRPMQIGIGGQADWAMSVQKTQKVN